MRAASQPWYNTAIWFGYSIGGIVIAVGISLLALAAMKLDISIGAITNAGQFALYSAGMWTTTYYQIARPNPIRLPLTEILGLVSFVGVSLSVALFVFATLFSNGANIEAAIIQWPSIALFVVSAIIAFLAVAWDNRRTGPPDIQGIQAAKQRDLNQAFDRTHE